MKYPESNHIIVQIGTKVFDLRTRLLPAIYRMDSASAKWGNKFHFVTYTGAPTTDPRARRLAKQNVMQHVRRNRKHLSGTRRYVPLQCELDVPPNFIESHVQQSERLDLGIGKEEAASAENKHKSFKGVLDISNTISSAPYRLEGTRSSLSGPPQAPGPRTSLRND